MGNKKPKASKMKIKLKTEHGTEIYVKGDNADIPDQVSPNPTPNEIESRLSGLGDLQYVSAIFYSHSSPG